MRIFWIALVLISYVFGTNSGARVNRGIAEEAARVIDQCEVRSGFTVQCELTATPAKRVANEQEI